MSDYSNKVDKFDSSYYDSEYFASVSGKKFRRLDNSEDTFGYRNPEGEWMGCIPICQAWKTLFTPRNQLDVGCARGTFIGYSRELGIKAVGFDFSDWAIAHPYKKCKPEWVFKHDCTQPFPYGDNSFDFVTVLDLCEHLFENQIDSMIKEVHRVANRFVFFLIATVGAGSGVNTGAHTMGYVLKRGEEIPIELEACAAAGHVTVMTREWWEQKLLDKEKGYKWVIRRDLEITFREIVPADVLANWKTVIVLEKEI